MQTEMAVFSDLAILTVICLPCELLMEVFTLTCFCVYYLLCLLLMLLWKGNTTDKTSDKLRLNRHTFCSTDLNTSNRRLLLWISV